MPELSNVLILHDQNLDVRLCSRFAWDGTSGRITTIEFADNDDYNMKFLSAATNRVVIPAFVNAHTHIGDSCLPDGATGLTLEQAFFRPNGFKYTELAKCSEKELIDSMSDTMHYMLSTGTIMHWDFREQGVHGLHLIRQAEKQTPGFKSIVLSQFDRSPFDDDVDKSEDLPEQWKLELENLWNRNAGYASADGFSESTMNDLTDRAWTTINDMSRKNGHKLRAIHCLESETYRSVSLAKTGGRQSDLQRAFELYDPDIIVHLTEATQDDIAVIVDQEKTLVDRFEFIYDQSRTRSDISFLAIDPVPTLSVLEPMLRSVSNCHQSIYCSRAVLISCSALITSCSINPTCWLRWILPTECVKVKAGISHTIREKSFEWRPPSTVIQPFMERLRKAAYTKMDLRILS